MVDDTIVEEPGVVYGVIAGRKLLLDVYRPHSGVRPRPAVILIHGGGMWIGSRSDMQEAARALAENGFIAFAIDYFLVDDAAGRNCWPVQLDDAQKAIRWVRVHAPEYEIDPNRVAAFGWSAGGQLAALLSTRETRQDYGNVSILNRVNLAVVLAADIDLAAYTQPPARDEVIALLGGTPDEVPEQYFDA